MVETAFNTVLVSSGIELTQEGKTLKVFIAYVKLLSQFERLMDPFFKQRYNYDHRSKKKKRILRKTILKFPN